VRVVDVGSVTEVVGAHILVHYRACYCRVKYIYYLAYIWISSFHSFTLFNVSLALRPSCRQCLFQLLMRRYLDVEPALKHGYLCRHGKGYKVYAYGKWNQFTIGHVM